MVDLQHLPSAGTSYMVISLLVGLSVFFIFYYYLTVRYLTLTIINLIIIEIIALYI